MQFQALRRRTSQWPERAFRLGAILLVLIAVAMFLTNVGMAVHLHGQHDRALLLAALGGAGMPVLSLAAREFCTAGVVRPPARFTHAELVALIEKR